MPARTGLWEPWVSNHPGPPGLRSVAWSVNSPRCTRPTHFRPEATMLRSGTEGGYLAGQVTMWLRVAANLYPAATEARLPVLVEVTGLGS